MMCVLVYLTMVHMPPRHVRCQRMASGVDSCLSDCKRQDLLFTIAYIRFLVCYFSEDSPVSASILLKGQWDFSTCLVLCRCCGCELRSSFLYRKRFTHWAISSAYKKVSLLACFLPSSSFFFLFASPFWYECFAWMHVCTQCACLVSTKVTSSCWLPCNFELPCGCWELNSGPLQEQQMLLTMTSLLQDQNIVVFSC